MQLLPLLLKTWVKLYNNQLFIRTLKPCFCLRSPKITLGPALFSRGEKNSNSNEECGGVITACGLNSPVMPTLTVNVNYCSVVFESKATCQEQIRLLLYSVVFESKTTCQE